MYSKQNFDDSLSSDNSYYDYFDTTSEKPIDTKPWIKVPVNNVREKIKYFSENSSVSEDSFKEFGAKKKIIKKEFPLEFENKLYTSRTEIGHTKTGK